MLLLYFYPVKNYSMVQIVFFLIVAIIVVDFIFERIIDYLNTTRWSDMLPEKLKGIYDEEAYQKSQAYKKANYRFEILTSSFSFLLILLMLFFNGFALVDGWVAGLTMNVILSALLFFAIIGIASDILTTPFAIYDTFVIEERFGFNKTTPATFIFDKIKGWLLSAILGGGLLALILFIWTRTGDSFWLLAWGVITLISVFMAMFYSNLIVPLFNKQTPLEEGELKQMIEEFSTKAGFTLKNIYVIDGSKRSTKANAYFTGLGPKKRIVLYDTLINDLSNREIVAVLAHEIGHYKKKHTISGLLTGIIETGVMLFIFSLVVGSPLLSNALGVDVPKFHIGLIAFGILYSPISFVLSIFMNMVSRKNEYQADRFAAQYGLANELASGLKKLSVKNLSNLTPHPLYVFFHYSHPTLLQRLNKLEN
jgi:STE24 endopeptidase